MTDHTRIEDLPVLTEIESPAWGGDFAWANDDLFQRDYQGLLASPWGDGVIAYRNEDVVTLMKHPLVTHQTLESSVSALTPPGAPADKGLSGFMAVNSFTFRAPEHKPFKQLTADPLAPASLADFRGTVRAIIDSAIAEASTRPSVDFWAEVANPLVIETWATLIGTTPEEGARLVALGQDLAILNDLSLGDELVARCNASADEYMDILTQALRRSYATGEYPLLTALVDAHSKMGDLGRPHEPFAPFASAMADGWATLPVFLNTVIWSLVEFGPQAPAAADVDQWAAAFTAELLRRHTIIAATVRQVAEPFEYQGVHLPEGTNVWMLWLIANRDPNAFDNPLEFRLEREGRRKQVTFGGGAYACSGMNLARLVVEETLKSIATSGTTVQLVEQPSWTTGSLLHHLDALTVSFSQP